MVPLMPADVDRMRGAGSAATRPHAAADAFSANTSGTATVSL
jgi:hypothetical protein